MGCEYCHSYPHLPGCPNAPEPETVAECFFCKRAITVGEEYMDFDGVEICSDCMDNETATDILEKLGAERRIGV